MIVERQTAIKLTEVNKVPYNISDTTCLLNVVEMKYVQMRYKTFFGH